MPSGDVDAYELGFDGTREDAEGAITPSNYVHFYLLKQHMDTLEAIQRCATVLK